MEKRKKIIRLEVDDEGSFLIPAPCLAPRRPTNNRKEDEDSEYFPDSSDMSESEDEEDQEMTENAIFPNPPGSSAKHGLQEIHMMTEEDVKYDLEYTDSDDEPVEVPQMTNMTIPPMRSKGKMERELTKHSRPMFNRHEMCYLNSSLQGLVGLNQFTQEVLSHNHNSEVGQQQLMKYYESVEGGQMISLKEEDCPFCIIKSTITALTDFNKRTPVDASSVFKFANGRYGIRKGVQCDADEFLLLLINVLKTELFDLEVEASINCQNCGLSLLEVAPPEKQLSCALPSKKGTVNDPISVQECVNAHFKHEKVAGFRCTNSFCQEDDGNKIKSVVRAPECLLIHLNRSAQSKNKKYFKRHDYITVNDIIYLRKNLANQSAKYELRAVIHHQGPSLASGHYTCSRRIESGFVEINDDLQEAFHKNVDGETPYLILYQLADDKAQSTPSIRQRIKKEAEEVSPENAPDVEIIFPVDDSVGYSNSGSSDDIQRYNLWWDKYSSLVHNKSLLKSHVLVMLLPNHGRCRTFKTLYERCQRGKNPILYTLMCKGSEFINKIIQDPEVKENYQVFSQEIIRKPDTGDINASVALDFVTYIVHSVLHKDNCNLEFFFEKNPSSALTSFLMRYWNEIKETVIEYIPSLVTGMDIFCPNPCEEACLRNNLSYHRSLADMKPVEFPASTCDEALLSSWRFLNDEYDWIDHPMEKLFSFPSFEKEEKRTEQLINHIRNFDPLSNGPFHFYLLLIVNDETGSDPDNLLDLWNDNMTEFALYAGITRHGKFREGHLVPKSKGGRTSVSAFLKDNSNVYRVLSQKFESYIDVTTAESQMIAILKERIIAHQRDGVGRRFTLLNKVLSGMPLFSYDEEEKEAFDKFLNTRLLPIRFTNEIYFKSQEESGIFQRHLVQFNVLSTARQVGSQNGTNLRKKAPVKDRKGMKYSANDHDIHDHSTMNRAPRRNDNKSKGTVSVKKKTFIGLKPHKCQECDLSFGQKFHLTRHVNAVHKELKPHKCQECDFSCAQKFQLTQHVNAVHKGLKPHKCPKCDYSCAQKHDMTRHVNAVHKGLKPHKCQECDYSCSTKTLLTNHVNAVHKGLKPHKCQKCDYVCARKNQLTKHSWTVHKDKDTKK